MQEQDSRPRLPLDGVGCAMCYLGKHRCWNCQLYGGEEKKKRSGPEDIYNFFWGIDEENR